MPPCLLDGPFTVADFHRLAELGILHEDDGIVRVQNPVVLADRAEPEPDLAVLRPRGDGYRRSHPRPADVLLVIEVADASLEYDRDVKLPPYAAAGIPEVWLVDLDGETITAYGKPAGDGYTRLTTVSRGGTIGITGLPTVTVEVSQVLGQP
jgi:Uma2 family endonuclease